MLEKLSPQLRHALITLLGSLITVGITYIHSFHFSKPVEALIGSSITSLILIITPLTSQYGVVELDPNGTRKEG